MYRVHVRIFRGERISVPPPESRCFSALQPHGMAGRALYRPGAVLRTGLTHFFERRAAGTVDRSEVAAFWESSSSGAFSSVTPNVCSGFVQANMVW